MRHVSVRHVNKSILLPYYLLNLRFFFRFVLCPECDNPETDLIVSVKRNTISQGCKACGYHGVLESNHKLMTFILKNPPNFNPASQGASLTEGKRSKRSKRNGDTNGDQDPANDSSLDASLADSRHGVSNFILLLGNISLHYFSLPRLTTTKQNGL